MNFNTAIAPPAIPLWQTATWDDYVAIRDADTPKRVRLFFHRGRLFVDMGAEGINHASVSDLLTMLFVLWFGRQPQIVAQSFGGCLLEKAETAAAAPDLVLYLGEGIPQWREGEPRRIDLNRWRVPDLVGEVADTTLADDLDEKKQIYAELKIGEYWVIDVRGEQVLAFHLQPDGTYKRIVRSTILTGLPIALLEQTIARLDSQTNIAAAMDFAKEIEMLDRI